MNYHLHQPGKKAVSQLYHVNLLKCWIELMLAHSAISVPTSGPKSEQVHKGENLMPIQLQQLQELNDQFRDMFLY